MLWKMTCENAARYAVTVSTAVAFCIAFGRTDAYELDTIIQHSDRMERAFLSQPSIYIEFYNDRRYPVKGGELREKVVSARKDSMYYLQVEELSRRNLGDYKRPVERITWQDDFGVRIEGGLVTISAEPELALYDANYYCDSVFYQYWNGLTAPTSLVEKMFGHHAVTTIAQLSTQRCILPSLQYPKSPWTIVPQLQSIDGAACVLLERNGWDRLWLDTNRNFACRRRQISDAGGTLAQEFHLLGLKQFAKEIWLPMSIVKTYYNTDGQVQLIETITVARISFDELPDSLFELPIPDNAFVIDNIRGLTYPVHPTGATDDQVLYRTLVTAERQLDERSPKGPSMLALSVSLVTLFLGLLMSVVQLRLRRRVRI